LPTTKETTPLPFNCQGKNEPGVVFPDFTYGFQFPAIMIVAEKTRIQANIIFFIGLFFYAPPPGG
jgi:hypothetical protein